MAKRCYDAVVMDTSHTVHVRLTPALRTALQRFCARLGLSMTAALRLALADYLAKQEQYPVRNDPGG